jgi:predicted RNase H-like HicB family nuclease
MANDRSYRVVTSFDPESETYLARVVELEVEGRGETRAEAVERLEEALEGRIEAAATSGQTLPPPAGALGSAKLLELRLSPVVAEDLHEVAHEVGMPSADLALQVLIRGLAQLRGARSVASEAATEPPSPQHGRGQRNRGGKDGGRRRREGYRPDMDDQANFLAYVRDMEKGGRGRR